jgi:hypothetical protein
MMFLIFPMVTPYQTLTFSFFLLTEYFPDNNLLPSPTPSVRLKGAAEDDVPQIDDFRTEYHPSSGRPPILQRFEDYGQHNPSIAVTPSDERPWEPFRSRLDFEIAELALEAALNKKQTDRLLSLFDRCARQLDNFTLRNHADMSKLWDLASDRCTHVSLQ